MCGIFGTFRHPASVEQGLEKLRHRGPDGIGIEKAGDMTHGHVRLALLDLTDASAQPFQVPGGILSYNGELWNFLELREELSALGWQFRTTGDTEVVAASLATWGEGGLSRLDGMFAFAWSSPRADILVRDRFGKIPLYVQRKGVGFVWSSERKAMPEPWAAAALPPGALLDLRTGRIQYWYQLPLKAGGDAGEVFPAILRGVARRLVADAPLCCLISGGVDSAIILLAAQRHRPDIVAYTAYMDPKSEDLLAARRLCQEASIELREVRVPPATPDSLGKAFYSIEIASKAQVEIAALCIPLASRIAADGFKACLSGEAADELFGGYGNMCIQASKATDAEWIKIKAGQVAKMARGNFVRCNKAFMAHGVECRLPYMERGLVESVVGMGKEECPPGKGLLKASAGRLVPRWVVRRQKQTFQGAGGSASAAAKAIANPIRFYNAESVRRFGIVARE